MKYTSSLLFVQLFLFGLLGLWTPALAADPTWLPSFNKNRHVYVDPHIMNSRYPINVSGLDSEIQTLQKKHHLQVYTIVTLQGDDPEYRRSSGMKYAPWKLNQLARMWQGSSDYPMNDYLLVFVVRKSDDADKFSVAANGGVRLQGFGLTAERFSQETGPVLSVFKSHLPYDVKGYFTSVVTGVNNEIDGYYAEIERDKQAKIQAQRQAELDYIQAQKDAEARRIQEAEHAEQERLLAIKRAQEAEEFRKALPGILWKAFLLLSAVVALGVGIALDRRYKREQRNCNGKLDGWNTKLQNADQLYLKLEGGYMGFIQHNDDWAKRFKGVTLERFKTALRDFALFNAVYLGAKTRFDEAKRLGEERSIMSWATAKSAKTAAAKLTTEIVIITGDELPLEKAKLFEGLVEKTPYTPDALLQTMDELFDRTNQALAAIMKSFEGSEQNRKDIENVLKEVEAKKTTLAECALTFAPYQSRLDSIHTGQSDLLRILVSDPLAAFDLSEKVEDQARALLTDLDRAMTRKSDLLLAQAEIDKAVNRIKEVRAQAAVYQYPMVGNEYAPAGYTTTLFALSEKEGNPDLLIDQAVKRLAQANEALLAADFANSDFHRQGTVEAAHDALALTQSVLDAKAFVERQVALVRADRDKLHKAIPGAQKDVATLTQEFLEENYSTTVKDGGKSRTVREPDKLTAAEALLASMDAELAKVKKDYDNQDYLSSRKKLERLGGGIHDASDSLVEIHVCLEKLISQRKHCKDVIAVCQQLAGALQVKLTNNNFTTPAGVDAEFTRLQGVLAQGNSVVSQAITDWPLTVLTVDKLEQSLKAVDKQIDESKAQHAAAKAKLAEAQGALEKARRQVAGGDTRQPAKDKLSEAVRDASSVQKTMQQAKSDWSQIARRADDARQTANKARELAEADERTAGQARTAIAEAERQIASAKHCYRHGVSADLSSAAGHLGHARQKLNNQRYEDAAASAKSATRAAIAAESDANDAVAAIDYEIAEAERRRRDEERRRREEEEEEERRRRDSYSSSNSSSTSSDFSGGGWSGGGDGGGGWSGGGGDF